MINNRLNDSIVEREIGKFLDGHLYNDKEIFSEFARTNDRENQFNGSDLILSSSDGRLYRAVVDEKVAARYANRGLNSFSLELSFIDRGGNKHCGWFTDMSKRTEYYLFGWLNKVDIPFIKEQGRYDTDKIRAENIRELEYCLVSKKKILDFLEARGWTLEKLGRQDARIRENGFVKTNKFIDDVSFRYSPNYIEQPINLLLKKETYIKLSSHHGILKE